MSQVADSTLPFDDPTTPVSTPGSRARSDFSANTSQTQSMQILKFNLDGFPISKDSAKASTLLGKLVKSHIPISAPTWKDVAADNKMAVWKALKEAYNFNESQKPIQLSKANEAWKKYKCKLRKRLIGNNMSDWLKAMPKKGVNPTEWMQFCVNEGQVEQKELRLRNTIIKNSCPRKSTHNTGRLGYARAEEKYKDEHSGRKPMRGELWLYTHKKKGGGYAPHDEELARKLEGLLEIMREKGEMETLDSGPIFDTFGIDKRGRVRCVGSTISRKTLLASSFAKHMLEEVEANQDDWKEEIKFLKENSEYMMSQMNELVAELKNGKFNYGSVRPTPNDSQCNSSNIQLVSPSSSFTMPILCHVVSHMGVVVAYGRKSPPGSVSVVHDHVMQPREAKVVIDEVKDPFYPVWGGEQDGLKTLGEVTMGSYLYWHDDLLPPAFDN